jgi:hypothetical protein
MRKLAIALVAAITVGAAAPAMAQVGFYAGPGGIGVGVGPGYYGGPYWHHRHYNHWHHHYYVR